MTSIYKVMKMMNPGKIQLIEMGWVPAKPAREFKVGEKIMYNYGYVNEIVSIEQKNATTLIFTVVRPEIPIASRMPFGKTIRPTSSTVTLAFITNKIPIAKELANHFKNSISSFPWSNVLARFILLL